MKVQHIASACAIIEHRGVRVLCDPWLVDGIYYGAWYHNPPLSVTPRDFQDVDYIYLSHIHGGRVPPVLQSPTGRVRAIALPFAQLPARLSS
ncbi:MAG: MBL fold metallo-hydrolase [Gemmatimonadetes bacterium]|nr:MBL fold metallo-hydrolase [Gemmatimonadota bacterium]